MKALCGLLLACCALAGCQSASDQSTPATATATPPTPSAAPEVAPTRPTTPDGPPYAGYHRYRGMIGGQPVTLVLTITPESEKPVLLVAEGSYRYERHPGGQLLLSTPQPYRPRQPLRLTEADSGHPQQATGRWQATQAAGALLTGTWTSPVGKQLPFSLREDYTDGQGRVAAVGYELLQEGEEAPTPAEREPGESKAAYSARIQELVNSSRRDYLHLLGPDTLRPELRALQCPVPARRRQQLREELGYPGGADLRNELTVVYNDHGLLSLSTVYEGNFKDATRPQHGAGASTYDLHTGRALTIAALIRPGTDTILSRLITQHLENDEHIPADELRSTATSEGGFAKLPEQGLGVVERGLAFTYSSSEILSIVEPPVTLVVPWAELQPLLRPDSPVARMLRERGLWCGR